MKLYASGHKIINNSEIWVMWIWKICIILQISVSLLLY